MKIYINPGHSANIDTGKEEKTINSDVANKLVKIMKDEGHDVYSLYFLNPHDAANSANTHIVDVFIGIECNASADTSVNGVESYAYNGSTEGMLLASCINHAIVTAIPVQDHGVKTSNYSILRNVKAYAAIVKIGYITNTEDERMLTNERFRDKIAKAIANGIKSYIAAK